jgi:hypothetical protein
MNKQEPQKLDAAKVREIIGRNFDSRKYFFSKVGKEWIDWLWTNGFLDPIKEKGVDDNSYRYVTPELDYLVRMAEFNPSKVVDIMLTVPISKDNFNAEVLDRFSWICGGLPANELARMIPKIKDEKWPQVMSRYNHSGYEYQRMLEALEKAKDYDSLLSLIEVLFTVRTKEELKEKGNGFSIDNPFYLTDIGHIDLFDKIMSVDDSHVEEALKITTATMNEIILLGEKTPNEEPFKVREPFYLFDVDFFEVSVNSDKHFSVRDDVRNLAASIKELSVRAIGNKCDDASEAKRIYKEYIDSLPFSMTMWRLRLFFVSLCPDVFKQEIRDFLFRLFDEQKWSNLLTGAEYEQLLKRTFSTLGKEDKELYISKVFGFFGDPAKEEPFYKQHGHELLSSIEGLLSAPDKVEAEARFGKKPDPEYVPLPSITGGNYATAIHSRAPISQEELNKVKVSDIVQNLKSSWSPKSLFEQDTVRDFHNPLDAEGMGEALQKDMAVRLEEYVNEAPLFFDRETIHPQYTYSFMRGLYDIISKPEFDKNSINLQKVVDLFQEIVESGNTKVFTKSEGTGANEDTWIANWNWVHNSMADVLKVILRETKDSSLLDFEANKKVLLEIISYLFEYPNPLAKDNMREHGGDPYTTAINSVRGHAFESLVFFVENEDKDFKKGDVSRVSPEVKAVYEKLLAKEDTFAIMFMFGRYLPFFYYRDKEWMKQKAVDIFPENSDKKDLYLSAWEGYISNSLYKEMITDFGNLYKRAIHIKSKDYTKRSYFVKLDEGLGTHIALALLHFPDFDLNNALFKEFWFADDFEKQEEFISFIGRYSISRDKGAEFIKENKIDVNRLKEIWDWVLEKGKDEKVFASFGFWMNTEPAIFGVKWLADHIQKTLEKSSGHVGWEYKLMKSLPLLAQEAPDETLRIISSYLLADHSNDSSFRASIYLDSEILKVVKMLFNNASTKAQISTLVNRLILQGGELYWPLKTAIAE